ncbi:PHB depolymerase family esterase [Thalassotalea sp. PS06]|uniref:extracellular catalytic domain type 2 short-chain-length polyhydroxyalkanoate depolymerase n=1 Tax=Thalassotalea sp. PS06 TaxID=2594005 RepID=UPI001162C897|nr:PHB depolymerase family esterase [Thalassotalea sp. PS06]QDP02755.1 polyhydroxybutyrate depolymerase [Thalassotalea sp. PS06]
MILINKTMAKEKTITNSIMALTLVLSTSACSDSEQAAQSTKQATAASSQQQVESKINLTLEQTTVSGLSSGAYMAHQLHIAYSDKIKGAALLAGGPYGCAKGDLNTALGECMAIENAMDVAPLVELAKQAQEKGDIAPLENLAEQPVWIFHGTTDNRVNDKVTQASADLYTRLGATPVTEFNIKAGHGFPTETNGVQCDSTEAPFINQCGYDAAGTLLTHLYGELNSKSEAATGELVAINQADFVTGDAGNTLAETGYAYVPTSCATGEECRIHIALHGCKQNEEAIDKAFIKDTGYNAWADTNNIVVLYPQTKSSFAPLNPNACWDWWGYTGAEYQSRDGAQMQHVMNMVAGLSEAL